MGTLTFHSGKKTIKHDHSNDGYWKVLTCGTVYYIAQGGSYFWHAVDEILYCDHSNESYWAALSCSTVCYAVMLYKVALMFELSMTWV